LCASGDLAALAHVVSRISEFVDVLVELNCGAFQKHDSVRFAFRLCARELKFASPPLPEFQRVDRFRRSMYLGVEACDLEICKWFVGFTCLA